MFERNQMKPEGVGVFDPVVVKPRNESDSAKNRRVEFRIYKLRKPFKAELMGGKEPFDY